MKHSSERERPIGRSRSFREKEHNMIKRIGSRRRCADGGESGTKRDLLVLCLKYAWLTVASFIPNCWVIRRLRPSTRWMSEVDLSAVAYYLKRAKRLVGAEEGAQLVRLDAEAESVASMSEDALRKLARLRNVFAFPETKGHAGQAPHWAVGWIDDWPLPKLIFEPSGRPKRDWEKDLLERRLLRWFRGLLSRFWWQLCKTKVGGRWLRRRRQKARHGSGRWTRYWRRLRWIWWNCRLYKWWMPSDLRRWWVQQRKTLGNRRAARRRHRRRAIRLTGRYALILFELLLEREDCLEWWCRIRTAMTRRRKHPIVTPDQRVFITSNLVMRDARARAMQQLGVLANEWLRGEVAFMCGFPDHDLAERLEELRGILVEKDQEKRAARLRALIMA
jgi:hypothetical protein